MFDPITIIKEVAPATDKAPAKTRQFSVSLASYAALASTSATEFASAPKVERPVFLVTVGSEEASRAFHANFRGGFKAQRGQGAMADVFEMPSHFDHRWVVQRVEGGTITMAYVPGLLHLEPTEPPDERIDFLLMPESRWLDAQAVTLAEVFGKDAREGAMAALFGAYLDRRTPLPILQDLRFHLQTYRAALKSGLLHAATTASAGPVHGEGFAACGLEPPLLCSATSERVEELLVAQTTAFFKKGLHHGSDRFRADRRLLPDAFVASGQPCLDLDVAGGKLPEGAAAGSVRG